MPGTSSPGPRKNAGRIVFGACALLAIGTGLLWRPDLDLRLRQALPEQTPGEGFTTSGTCQACHPDQYDAWHRSYHRTMTQAATPSAVLGRFDGAVLEDRGHQWRMERRGDEFWVEMPDPVWFDEPAWFMQRLRPEWPDRPPRLEARVVMTTGSHHLQNYWIRRPEATAGPLDPDNGALIQVPWVWLIPEARWVPNQDSFLRPPSASLQGAASWNATCSQCHSVGTEPRVLEALGRFDTRAVELGIACEACHGPAQEHVRSYQSPLRRYLRYFAEMRNPESPDPTIVDPAKLDARGSVETCAQCHSFGEWKDKRAFANRGVPFRPGNDLHESRSVFRLTDDPNDPLMADLAVNDPEALNGNFWPDGTIRVAGREYNGLLEDVHFQSSELNCLTCHSMHDYRSADAQLSKDESGDETCLGCHTELADEVAEHTRHGPESSGSECMNCHMPHTTYGLFSAMRSHRIDSPNVQRSVESGRPNACNLCHLDQTLEWSSRYLNEWYGHPVAELGEDERTIAAAVLWALKGDAAQRSIVAWHLGWPVARQASGGDWTAAYLAQLLTDPYAATRLVAYRSLRGISGYEGFAYDYVASRADLEAKATEATAIWMGTSGADSAMSRLLIGANRAIDVEAWLRLLEARDQRPLAIVE